MVTEKLIDQDNYLVKLKKKVTLCIYSCIFTIHLSHLEANCQTPKLFSDRGPLPPKQIFFLFHNYFCIQVSMDR